MSNSQPEDNEALWLTDQLAAKFAKLVEIQEEMVDTLTRFTETLLGHLPPDTNREAMATLMICRTKFRDHRQALSDLLRRSE